MMTIDWMKPIELETDPPRPARVIGEPDIDGVAAVCAEWREGDSEEEQAVPFYVLHTGYVNIDPAGRRHPRVRNVATTPDLAAELAEALRALIDAPEPDCIPSRKWALARAALAKWEARK